MLGERDDDVLGDSVRQIVLLRIAAQIVERQDRNGRPAAPTQRNPSVGGTRTFACPGLRVRPGDAGFALFRTSTAARALAARPDHAHEPEAFARVCPDHGLTAAAVAHGLARRIDPAGQGRIRDDAPAPDRRDQIVLRHHAVPVLDQVEKDIEHLWFESNLLGAAPELPPSAVEHIVAKAELHVAVLHNDGVAILMRNQARLMAKSSRSQSLPCGAETSSTASIARRATGHRMEDVMSLKALSMVALGLAVACHAPEALAQAGDGHAIVGPGDIKWSPGPPSIPAGAEAAVLYGDPGKDGLFALRLKLPKGYALAPHTHPKPEVVTVISGTFRLGMGESADRSKAQPLAAGSFFALQ